MASLRKRISEQQTSSSSSSSFSGANRARDVGIILCCVVAIAILLLLIARLCGFNFCRCRRPGREQARPPPAHMDPARFMQQCRRRNELIRTRGAAAGLLTHDEVDRVAPLTTRQHTASASCTATAARRRNHNEMLAAAALPYRPDAVFLPKEKPPALDDRSLPAEKDAPAAACPEPDQAVCCVCLEAYEPGEPVRTTPCSHVFHAGCLEAWLSRYQSRCPLCQMDLRPEVRPPVP